MMQYMVHATPRSTTKQSSAQRNQRIAIGIVAGKSVAAIAREEGISRAWAFKLANSSPVTHIIGSLVNSELVTMHQLFMRALQVIEDASHAELIVVYQGKPLSLGPDHYARLTVNRILKS